MSLNLQKSIHQSGPNPYDANYAGFLKYFRKIINLAQ